MPIKPAITSPIQYAEKLPAVRPARMLSEAPPAFDASTASRTWPELVEVKILITSGMIAPASVPHVMMVESFHQRVPSPRSPISRKEAMYVIATETPEVSQTRKVSGASKSMRVAAAYLDDWMPSLTA